MYPSVSASIALSPKDEGTENSMIPIPAPIHSILALAAFAGSIASFFAAKFAQAMPQIDNGIFGSNYLIALCLSGSLGGSIVFVLAFSQNDTRRQVASKLLSCSILGMMVTPILIQWLKWPENAPVVLASSGGVSLLSWAVLLKVFPFLVDKASNLVTKADPPK